MAVITNADVEQIIGEINSSDEKDRRQTFRRRGRIYKDGGKDFLIEHLTVEFGDDAIKEMRLAPINVMKSIVDKKSIVYKRPPIRQSEEEKDNALVDAYVEKMGFDSVMAKANRYFNLYSNCQLYTVPVFMGEFRVPFTRVLPPFLYSVDPNRADQTEMDALVLSNFTAQDEGLTDKQVTEVGSIKSDKGFQGDDQKIDTNSASFGGNSAMIWWTDEQHFTTDKDGAIMQDPFNPEMLNPIGIIPSVNLAKDRDNEFWAMQGEDLADLAIALQLGMSDLMSIAKMQGFSILTVTSPEQPQRLDIGLNKVVWLKQQIDGPTPSVSYVQASSPISEYKDLLLDLLGLTLTTNQLSPSSVTGKDGAQSVTSGFQALIQNSDNLQQLEQDKPVLRDAEQDTWQVIAKWHNLLHDKNELPPDLRELGKFSDRFQVNVTYQDMKPIESEEQRLAQVEKLMSLGLATKMDALKKLHPEMSDEQIEEKLNQVEEEKQQNMLRATQLFQPKPTEDTDGETEET